MKELLQLFCSEKNFFPQLEKMKEMIIISANEEGSDDEKNTEKKTFIETSP